MYLLFFKNISKSIMSPMISNLNTEEKKASIETMDLQNEKKNLQQLRKFVEKNFDYVGKDFSKKVREVFYDKKNKKAIYGTTTPEEREELAEEGIDLVTIPWINKDN